MRQRLMRHPWWVMAAIMCVLLITISIMILGINRSIRSTTDEAMGPGNGVSILPLDQGSQIQFGHSDTNSYKDIYDLVARIQSQYQGQVGLAIVPVGDSSRRLVLGDKLVAPAWATLHVPIAIAALRAGHSEDSIVQMLNSTDSYYARVVFDSLGSGGDAAQLVNTVLRDTGDTVTSLPANNPSPCNYTSWSVADQAVFAANVSSLPESSAVLSRLVTPADSEAFGLGHLEHAVYKTGWGTDFVGQFAARQFGIVDTHTGRFAISIIVDPGDGTYGTARAMLNDLVDGLHIIASV